MICLTIPSSFPLPPVSPHPFLFLGQAASASSSSSSLGGSARKAIRANYGSNSSHIRNASSSSSPRPSHSRSGLSQPHYATSLNSSQHHDENEDTSRSTTGRRTGSLSLNSSFSSSNHGKANKPRDKAAVQVCWSTPQICAAHPKIISCLHSECGRCLVASFQVPAASWWVSLLSLPPSKPALRFGTCIQIRLQGEGG